MLIKFLEAIRYTQDGFTIERSHKGEVKDVADTAARALIQARKANGERK